MLPKIHGVPAGPVRLHVSQLKQAFSMKVDSTKPELLVLLGSGATITHIPGVQAITDHILSYPSRECRNDRLFKAATTTRADDNWIHLVYSELEKAWGTTPNFEQIVEAILLLESIPGELRRSGESIPGALFRPLDSIRNHGTPNATALIIVDRILRYIDKACGRLAPAGTRSPIVRFLNSLAKSFTLRIFSLNYDDLPDRCAFESCTGFAEDSSGAFDIDSVLFGGNSHCHYQLHGSVKFSLSDGRRSCVERFATRAEARKRRKLRTGAQQYSTAGFLVPTMPIITGLRKTDMILGEPFASYHHRFRHDAFACTNWLIVGYGGTDPHINSVLTAAADNHVRSERMLYAAVVSWFGESPSRSDLKVIVPWHPGLADGDQALVTRPSDTENEFDAKRLTIVSNPLAEVCYSGVSEAADNTAHFVEAFRRCASISGQPNAGRDMSGP